MFNSLNGMSVPENAPNEMSLVIGPTEVADVMIGKVVTLSPHHSFNDVANLMNDRYFRHCVVVDQAGVVIGVISDRDILRTLARNPNSRSKSLDQIMTKQPVTVKRNTAIIDAVGKCSPSASIACRSLMTTGGCAESLPPPICSNRTSSSRTRAEASALVIVLHIVDSRRSCVIGSRWRRRIAVIVKPEGEKT
jgi:hypothetical protein